MTSEPREIRVARIKADIDTAYIKWLHENHEWVVGATAVAFDAFASGYAAGYEAATDLITRRAGRARRSGKAR
jgi:hypothetical protein